MLTSRYGHGVYFAAESSTSMGSYARASMFNRQQADFPIRTATALVELGESMTRVSELIVSSQYT